MNLAAWSTWPSLAHLPEIVFAAEAQDPLARRAHLLPKPLGIFVRRNFLVAFINREPQSRRIEFQLIDQQVPGKLDCVFLEIIAKGKIAEHLEERVMPGGFADFVEVVVLAAGAYALLRRSGAHVLALLRAQEDVLKLIHSRVREQQCRIVGRQERRRTHRRVPVLLKVPQKSFANFVTSHIIRVYLTSVVIRVIRGQRRTFSLTSSNSNPCRSR